MMPLVPCAWASPTRMVVGVRPRPSLAPSLAAGPSRLEILSGARCWATRSRGGCLGHWRGPIGGRSLAGDRGATRQAASHGVQEHCRAARVGDTGGWAGRNSGHGCGGACKRGRDGGHGGESPAPAMMFRANNRGARLSGADADRLPVARPRLVLNPAASGTFGSGTHHFSGCKPCGARSSFGRRTPEISQACVG